MGAPIEAPSLVLEDEALSTPDKDGYLWARAEAAVPARSWTCLGSLDFPEGGAEDAILVSGAVGAKRKEDLHLWCPSVHTGWLPLPEFSAKCRSIRFAGRHAVWARNVSDEPFEQVIVRVRYKPGALPPQPGPDATAAYYASQVWKRTTYMGIPVLKAPTDLWILQEILHEVRPRLVIETGTFKGGSALYVAHVLDALFDEDEGDVPFAMVGSVDVEDLPADVRPHPRTFFFDGRSSTEPAVVEDFEVIARKAGPVLVLLDSDHSYDHVLAELRAYAPLVTAGSYLIVEDTNTPGPAEAVKDFLASPEGAGFSVDRSREKFGVTFNPGGYLKKAVTT